MDIQRLRNLTTGRLHTSIDHIYEDLAYLTGESGLMTHMLPRVMRSVEPWLRDNVPDARFWGGNYDTTHKGDYNLPSPTIKDKIVFFERFKEMQNPLARNSPVEGAKE